MPNSFQYSSIENVTENILEMSLYNKEDNELLLNYGITLEQIKELQNHVHHFGRSVPKRLHDIVNNTRSFKICANPLAM